VIFARVAGVGSCLPSNRVSNDDLVARGVDTNDEWIVARTGIKARHLAEAGQTSSELGLVAAQRALEMAGASAEQLDLIIVATSTPDFVFPSTACLLQAKLGNKGATAFDVQAVCSGFVYALTIAEKFIKSGSHKRALVVGAEVFSRILDWNDRGTCVLFGDGAGAVVLGLETAAEGDSAARGILTTQLHADGRHHDLLYVDGGPSTTGTVGKVRMKGREVFRHAVVNLAEVMEQVLHRLGLTSADIDWVVPHQANARILDATARKLGLPPEKVVVTVDQHANTSAASVPLALDTAVRDGRIQRGDLLVLEAMGGGLTWGAAVIRY